MYKALTLVITDKDLNNNTDAPIIARLRGTRRDVSEVDRAVYVDPDGKETYFKDRYPPEYLPSAKVVEERIERPLLAYKDLDKWAAEIRQARIDMLTERN